MCAPSNLCKSALLVAIGFGLTACVSPQDYESEPVKVETPAGVVTCQLYTRDLVVWDRAIDRPESMTVSIADAICVNEGKRRSK